jgi:uncharacterized iron-regulated membrane protein
MSHEGIFWRLRRVLFWVHLVMGVTAGVAIVVMSVTGAALGFEAQLVEAIDGAPRVVTAAGAARLPLDTLLARAALDPADVAVVTVARDPAAPVTVRLRARGAAPRALDPYTGATLPRSTRAAEAMAALRRWHRWLGQETGRGVGKALADGATLLFVFLGLTGLWLWWPRAWTAAALRAISVPGWPRTAKAREFNWHHVAGLWMVVPIIIVSVSGVWIGYEWPDRLMGAPARAEGQPRGAGGEGRSAPGEGRRERAGAAATADAGEGAGAPAPRVPLDTLLARAATLRDDWTTIALAVPGPRDRTVSATASAGTTPRADRRTSATLDAATGALRDVQRPDAAPLHRRVRGWMRFAHTGEQWGVAGQLVMTLASLAGALLVYTGLALSLRRLAAWRRREGRELAGA